MSPTEYQKRLQPLLNLSKLQEIVQEIVLSDQDPLKREKINEWEQGLRPDKEIIGYYSNSEMGYDYADFKNKINPRAGFGNVDLILTGQTSRSLFVKPAQKKGDYIFGMNDSHNLIGRYGMDILGLNQDWFNNRQNQIYRLTLVYNIKKNYKIA